MEGNGKSGRNTHDLPKNWDVDLELMQLFFSVLVRVFLAVMADINCHGAGECAI